MKDTRFFLPPDQRARLATVYSSGPDGKIVRAPEGARDRDTTSTARARASRAGRAVSTARTTRDSSR